MKRPILPVILVIIAGFSGETLSAQPFPPAPSIRLEYFPSIPKAIDGCGGMYTYDSVSLKREKYIFIDNQQELAFIHIGGKTIALKRLSEAALGKKTYKDVFAGSGYTVTVILKTVKTIDEEDNFVDGTLEVRKGQSVLKLKIHGEAGC
jgi:hypothetical protein